MHSLRSSQVHGYVAITLFVGRLLDQPQGLSSAAIILGRTDNHAWPSNHDGRCIRSTGLITFTAGVSGLLPPAALSLNPVSLSSHSPHPRCCACGMCSVSLLRSSAVPRRAVPCRLAIYDKSAGDVCHHGSGLRIVWFVMPVHSLTAFKLFKFQ